MPDNSNLFFLKCEYYSPSQMSVSEGKDERVYTYCQRRPFRSQDKFSDKEE